MVGFVDDNDVPRLGLFDELGHAVAAAHEMAGSDDERLFMPVGPGDGLLQGDVGGGRLEPEELVTIVNRPVEVELFAQLQLPLPADAGWTENQYATGFVGQPSLADEHAGLNRFAQADFVRKEQAWWPIAVEALEGADLVRPRLDIGGGLPYPLAAVGHFGGLFDEGPDDPPQVEGRVRRWWWRRWLGQELDRRRDLDLLEAGRKVVFRQEAEQVITEGIGNGHGDDVLGLTGPELGEVGFLGGDARVVAQPR